MKKSFEISGNNLATLQWLAMAYEQKGQYEDAIATFQKAREIEDTPDMRAFQARIYALTGKRSDALKTLAELKELSQKRYISPYYIAIIYAGLNDKDEAFAWMEKAFRDRSYWMSGFKGNPPLDSLRDDPRFQELLRQVNS